MRMHLPDTPLMTTRHIHFDEMVVRFVIGRSVPFAEAMHVVVVICVAACGNTSQAHQNGCDMETI